MEDVELPNLEFGRGICYSGYREGQSPVDKIYPSCEEIREDLQILHGNWQYLRVFDASPHAERVLEVIRDDGVRPGSVRLLVRFLCRYPIVVACAFPIDLLGGLADIPLMTAIAVQMLAIFVGFPLALATEGRTFSDMVTQTRVVYRLDAQK